MEGEYYKTKDSVAEYIRLAKDVNGAKLIKKLRKILPKGSSVLELGSGPGSDWKILSQTYDVVGSDLSSEFLAHLARTYPNDNFLTLNAVTLATAQRFNGIYSNKVLHHLTDAGLAKSIKRQAEVLLPDGIICHSFWKGEGSEQFKSMFVNYHHESDLRTFFEEKFDILSIDSYAEFEANDSLLLIGKKKQLQ